ncbi:MAG TPA: cytochrome c oxidase subunit II, partial [Allocoleopsis sp.]
TNQADVVIESETDYQQWLASAAAQPPTPAYNEAAVEYSQADQAVVKGWETVIPAPPPVVNYAPKHEPTSPPA